MNDQGFVRRFTEAMRPGAYLRIIVEGAVGAGDEIRIVEKPEHGLTVRDIFRISLEIGERSSDCRRSSHLGELAGMGATFYRGNERSPRRLGCSGMLLISKR